MESSRFVCGWGRTYKQLKHTVFAITLFADTWLEIKTKKERTQVEDKRQNICGSNFFSYDTNNTDKHKIETVGKTRERLQMLVQREWSESYNINNNNNNNCLFQTSFHSFTIKIYKYKSHCKAICTWLAYKENSYQTLA